MTNQRSDRAAFKGHEKKRKERSKSVAAAEEISGDARYFHIEKNKMPPSGSQTRAIHCFLCAFHVKTARKLAGEKNSIYSICCERDRQKVRLRLKASKYFLQAPVPDGCIKHTLQTKEATNHKPGFPGCSAA